VNAPDFAAIIAGAIGHGRVQYLDRMDASAVINTRVLELCENADTGCPGCTDCPTIGQLLAIGAAVMSARVEIDDYTVAVEAEGRTWHPSHAITLLDRLRAVQP